MRALFLLIFLSMAMDIAGLGFVYFKVNPQFAQQFVIVTKIAFEDHYPL